MVQNCIFDYMKRDLWLQLYGLTVKALKKISVLYCYYDWEMLIKRRYQAAPAERHWSLCVLLFLLIIQVFLICLRVPRSGTRNNRFVLKNAYIISSNNTCSMAKMNRIFYVQNLTAGLYCFASSQWTLSFSHPSLLLLLFALVHAQTNGLPFLTSVLLSYVCNFTSLQAQQDQ